MNDVDWSRLAEDARNVRATVWDEVVKSDRLLGRELPMCADAVREAYLSLRIDYQSARALYFSGGWPEAVDTSGADLSFLKGSEFEGKVLRFMDAVASGCVEQGGSPDDETLARVVGKRLMTSGLYDHPMT